MRLATSGPGSAAPLECRVEVRGEIRREDHNAVESLELAQEHVHRGVGLALVRKRDAHGTTCGDRIGFVEEEHRLRARARWLRHRSSFRCPGGREVEREPKAGRVSFAKTPATKDEDVVVDLRECIVKRLPRGRRQDHVGERALGNDRLDRGA